MTVEFRPLSPVIGAEVIGIDPARPLDDSSFAELLRGWLKHQLLLFRDVIMTPEEQIAFTRRFGELHIMSPPDTNLPGHPEIFVVSNVEENGKALGMKRVGLGWHTDGEDKAIPNAGSFLYALEVPPEEGDTYFANMYAAYEALPEEIKRKIEGRRACFSRVRMHDVHYPHLGPLTEAQKAARPDVFHPLVRTHPLSGRKALYIGRWAIDIQGMPEEEGRRLVRELHEFSIQPRFVYRHRWRKGDALLWDNRCMQHRATEFDETRYRRHMHRTTLEGDRPF